MPTREDGPVPEGPRAKDFGEFREEIANSVEELGRANVTDAEIEQFVHAAVASVYPDGISTGTSSPQSSTASGFTSSSC